jgi:hypothetical protein
MTFTTRSLLLLLASSTRLVLFRNDVLTSGFWWRPRTQAEFAARVATVYFVVGSVVTEGGTGNEMDPVTHSWISLKRR